MNQSDKFLAIILKYFSGLNKPAFNQSINQCQESNKMNKDENNGDSRYFVALSDGKTNFEISEKEFNEIKIAIERNQKFYELVQTSKDTVTKININLNNVISLNEKVNTAEAETIKIADDKRDKIIQQCFHDIHGRNALIESMSHPMYVSLNQISVVRNVLKKSIYQNEEHEKFVLDEKTFSKVIFVDKNKNLVLDDSDKEFYIPSYVTLEADDSIRVENCNFKYINDVQIDIRNNLATQENILFFQMLEKAAEISGNIVESNNARLVTPDNLDNEINKAFAKIEKSKLTVANIITNSMRFADMRSWGKEYLDFVTEREMLLTGIFARIWNANVRLAECIPDNYVFLVTVPELLGNFFDKKLLYTKNIGFNDIKLDMKAIEEIGMSIVNPAGVCLIKLKA